MSLTVDIKKRLGDFFLDVSFETDGSISGLLGASGCGKSITLMCIAGIMKPDSGKIVLNGRTLFSSELNINLKPQKRQVGYLFQNYALFPNMTVQQNILCGLRSTKDKEKKENILYEIIKRMQLTGYENHYPSQLSGGGQQRTALARILVGEPKLLMLDEPFSALDSHLRGQLQVEMKKMLKLFGKDVVIVTHSRDEAYKLCDNIALIDSGKLTVHKETKQLFIDPESRSAALITGCKNIVEARKTGEYEVEAIDWGVRLITSRPVHDNLCAIGIRAHYFNPKSAQNRFPVHFIDEIESPFQYNIQFRYENQLMGTQDIWWRVSKEKKTGAFPSELGIAPANIMLLYS